MLKRDPILSVKFFCTRNGREPARDWLKSLQQDERRTIGEDIKTVQFGWPLGMPLVRKIDAGLWEVRSRLRDHIARILFTCHGDMDDHPSWIHQEITKDASRRFGTGKNTTSDVRIPAMNKNHIGSDFDNFLRSDGMLAECEAVAHKRVVTWQIEQEMKRRRISRKKLAGRMNTSPAVVDRLFTEEDSAMSFQLLEKAALALGRKLKVELA